MRITDQFGISEKEYKTIESQLEALEAKGYKILPVVIKMLPVQGMAGKSEILVSPNSNLEQLAWTVAHEIGHHNEPKDWVTFDIWNGNKCKVTDWKTQAQEISEQATENAHEFWAEKFAQENAI